jgi:hypothetical protein
MGLDINIGIDNFEELYFDDTYDRYKFSLSRTFCYLMCRKDVIDHEPELDQIGQLTGINIKPLYEMENYLEEEGLEFFISTAESDEEKQRIISKAEKDKENLKDNIDKILNLVNNLIDKLNSIENLPSLLKPTNHDTLGNDEYFSDFKKDKGVGYIGNNFGQDLRNFKRFLEFAKSKGRTSVWFNYG